MIFKTLKILRNLLQVPIAQCLIIKKEANYFSPQKNLNCHKAFIFKK